MAAQKEMIRIRLKAYDHPVSYTHLDVYKRQDEAEAGVPALSPPWTDPKKFTKNPVEKNGSIW